MMQYFEKFCQLIISGTNSTIEYSRVKTIIAATLFFTVIHTLNIVFVFLTQSSDYFNIAPIIIVYFVFLVPIVSIYFGYNNLAILLFNTVLPFFLLLVGLLLGDTFGVEYAFIPFVLISFFFYDKFIQRFFLSAYYLTLFLVIKFGTGLLNLNIEKINNQGAAFITNSIYILCFITIFILCQYFLSQIKKYQNSTDKLLDDLTIKNLQLKSAYTEMERFTYVASHDIKTPLRNISSFIGLMERDIEEGKTEDIPEYMDYIKSNSQSLHLLVSDILEYSKLNSKPNEAIKVVDLNLLAANVKRDLTLANRNSIIEIGDLPTLKANPTTLKMLIQNFIENGLKYNTNLSPKVSIKSVVFDSHFKLIFKDNGIGIPEKYHKNIFEMFKRLHSSAEYQGTGIGLAICRKIVEQLSGKIDISSAEGIGTTFTVLIPFKHITLIKSITTKKLNKSA